MTHTNILTEIRGRAGLIMLNRPQALNALNDALLAELNDALHAFESDPSIGAIVITGSERAFAAGADIKDMAEASEAEMRERRFIGRFEELRAITKPVIAAVSGFALGGGCELAMACDMIVASQSAKFGQPEVTIGVIPGAGGTQRLTRAVGKAIAMEMILNNRTLSAAEAERLGLVNRVVPVERCLDEALTLAAQIAERAPLAVRAAKQAINNAYDLPLTDGLADERERFFALFSTEDQKEGMRAFIEKRKPGWTGR